VTLAGVSGGRMTLLGGVSATTFGAAGLLAHGPARWALLALTVFLVTVTVLGTRPLKPSEAPAILFVNLAVPALWAWQLPNTSALMAANLCIAMVHTALMAPRPYAEIGLGTTTLGYLGAQLVFVDGGSAHLVQVAGVLLSQLAVGIVLLGVRITTERKVEEHVRTIASVNDRLERLNRVDPLTGLANRRQLDATFASAWGHAVTAGEPVSVLMIDVDHFKEYNDRYGHPEGDVCLQMVAAAVAAGARSTDIAARYGGEEFSVVLPGVDLDAARQAAERVRQSVAGLHGLDATQLKEFVSVSVGVASAVPGEGGSVTELIRQADLGLYEAKRNGRNRIGEAPTSVRDVSPVES
jgi:diguanylate cyclase (GGDEF)-like protein